MKMWLLIALILNGCVFSFIAIHNRDVMLLNIALFQLTVATIITATKNIKR